MDHLNTMRLLLIFTYKAGNNKGWELSPNLNIGKGAIKQSNQVRKKVKLQIWSSGDTWILVLFK